LRVTRPAAAMGGLMPFRGLGWLAERTASLLMVFRALRSPMDGLRLFMG